MTANPDAGSSLDAALQHHKTRGCSVLVAGDVPDAVVDRQVADLLGREPGSRLRVLGLVDRDVEVARARLRNTARGRRPATVVTAAEPARSAAANPGIDGGAAELDLRWTDGGIDAFEAELLDAIEDLARPHAPLDAAVLRVCVDSLCPLVREYGVEPATEFVSTVTAAVRERRGMVHVVSQGASGDDLPEPLAAEHDVLVDLRVTERGTEQRWRVPEFDVDIGWHALR